MEQLKLDFHIHSYYSPDGNMKPYSILEKSIERGLNAIAITDHNTTKGGKEARDLAEKMDLDLIVFVGQEVKTSVGELIVLNVEEDIPKNLSLNETISYNKKGFFIPPHPFDKFRKGIGEELDLIKSKIDAVEVFNSRTLLSSHNKLAESYAKRNRIPGIAGSDSHFEEELGSSYFMINSKKNKNSILRCIKKGDISIYGKQTGIKPHMKTSMIHFFK